MNKIENRTYLYKEKLNILKNDYIESIIIASKSKIKEDKEKFVYVISSKLKENKEMYLKLFKDKKYNYINICDINNITKRKNINIINFSNGDKLFISLKKNITLKMLKHICNCVAISIADIVIVNKINNIKESIIELDIALDFGKEVYAIPGDIFSYKNYLANFAIKQGAIPICSVYDVSNIR